MKTKRERAHKRINLRENLIMRIEEKEKTQLKNKNNRKQ